MMSAFEPAEKRDFQRIPVDAKASITGGGTFIACTISNLAEDGAKVRLLAEPDYLHIAVGADVCLNVPNFDEMCGHVIWIEDNYMGIRFDESHRLTTKMH